MSELSLTPANLRFNANQECQKQVTLHCSRIARVAYKIKCSDNNVYNICPVYGFLEKGCQNVVLEIHRKAAPPKEDIMMVQFAEVDNDEKDPHEPFRVASADYPETRFPLKAV